MHVCIAFGILPQVEIRLQILSILFDLEATGVVHRLSASNLILLSILQFYGLRRATIILL